MVYFSNQIAANIFSGSGSIYPTLGFAFAERVFFVNLQIYSKEPVSLLTSKWILMANMSINVVPKFRGKTIPSGLWQRQLHSKEHPGVESPTPDCFMSNEIICLPPRHGGTQAIVCLLMRQCFDSQKSIRNKQLLTPQSSRLVHVVPVSLESFIEGFAYHCFWYRRMEVLSTNSEVFSWKPTTSPPNSAISQKRKR